tara:strand:+ start:1548 stop:2399 length:852 start_codon:yes stop_codon:yes gene_type:complete
MLQIFFNQASYGPSKVIDNLLLGLKKAQEPYICNPIDIEINDPTICLNEHPILYSRLISHLSIGPNICVVPTDNPVVMRKEYKKFIINSEWTFNQYKNYIPENMLEIWPVGINTKEFPEVVSNTGSLTPLFDCLIYFKRRSEEELDHAKSLLNSLNQKWTIVEYGDYSEEEFKKIIKNSRYCFSLNNTESQGIALQEIMSSNLPMFVWDVDSWKDRGEKYECPATSIPYWSKECGEKTSNRNEIKDKFNFFIDNLDNYSPRNFILENLSLEKQAENLVSILNK